VCCGDDAVLGLPPAAIEMLARYRRMREEDGFGWAEGTLPDMFRWSRFSLLGPAFDRLAAAGDWAAAVDAAVGDGGPPAGIVVVRVGADGAVDVVAGPPRTAIPGRAVPVDVVLRSRAARTVTVPVAGEDVVLEPGSRPARPRLHRTGRRPRRAAGHRRRRPSRRPAAP
jgi:hypothetical protein